MRKKSDFSNLFYLTIFYIIFSIIIYLRFFIIICEWKGFSFISEIFAVYFSKNEFEWIFNFKLKFKNKS